MVLGVQLAFRCCGVADVVLEYERRVSRSYHHRLPSVSWRQLDLWTTRRWHQPRKVRGSGGAFVRGTPIARLRLPPCSPHMRQRPISYLECLHLSLGEFRPCPWYGCRYHLGRDGAVLVWPTIDPAAHETCALVVARHRARSPREIAALLNCSVQLVETTYRNAALKLRAALEQDEDADRPIVQARGGG
jgi:hypothetical protein